MNLTGKYVIKNSDDEYYVLIQEQAKQTSYFLFSKYSLEDQIRRIDGESIQDGPLTAAVLNSPNNVKYLVASAKRARVSG